MWGDVWKNIVRFWKWIATIAGGLLVLAGLVSDWVGRSTFLEDLAALLQKIKPVTDFFVRQPEWLFYPLCLLLIATGVAAAAANWSPALAILKANSDAGKHDAPRRIGVRERERIARTQSPRQHRILAIQYVDKGDCYDYARSIHQAFDRTIGWDMAPLQPVDAPRRGVPSGAAIVVVDRNAFTAEEQLLFNALTTSGIPFDVIEGRDNDHSHAAILIVPGR